ncbi:hypothetical protein VQ044_23995 [Aurantimonas sp. C2-5-R2]|uniref:hypothetical protein n=2 Tax=Aurantimonas TaxID=182269 RepID=UPI002F939130
MQLRRQADRMQAGEMIEPKIGDVFIDVKPPRHSWQVQSIYGGGTHVLERTDNPKIMRFLNVEALRDRQRYEPA